MDLTAAFWYVAGIILLLFCVQVLAKPLEWLARAVGNSILGGVSLWLIGLVGGLFQLHVAVNPVSAVVAGLLGVPGVVALVVMRIILG
ncbi:MAG TPA: pro-sigmaK processing inhibitor BofA family protein [Symbiobacteriaceae bacterium]|jgi:inhibitor of the pro-sigma K processing machinery|nr:pro-sigmaK processing inhibitor BofA family protein [Symbiobacteriaceae bacterium]